jgi:hypothetical protein
VLIEEIGHFVDSRINQIDTPGDEGEYFAGLVTDQKLNKDEIDRLKAEDDLVVVTIDGKGVEVEQNNNVALAIAPANANQTEGNSGTKPFTFTVNRTGDTSGTSSANWAVTGSGINPANAPDFGGILPSGTVNFAVGEISQTITVDVSGDTTIENDEGFTVTLSDLSNASITTATATGTITSDDLDDLVIKILGSGVKLKNRPNFTGDSQAAGIFSDLDLSNSIGINSGIVMSTGKVDDIKGSSTNKNTGTTTVFGTKGDTDLDTLINSSTNDAVVLEFDVVPNANFLSFNYVFASEEYTEYVNTQFNDVFAFFVADSLNNRKNIAVIPNTETAISVNNVNLSENANFYRNNPTDNSTTTSPFKTELDGFTTVLTAVVQDVKPEETYRFKLAIADAGDSGVDSAVFISSFNSLPLVPNNDSFEVFLGSQTKLDILKNDLVYSGKPLLIKFDPVGKNGGQISLDNNQTPTDLSDDKLIYTSPPKPSPNNIDTFEYTLGDDQKNTAIGKVNISIKDVFKPNVDTPKVNISTGLIFTAQSDGNITLDTNRESATPDEVTNVQNGTKSNFNHTIGLYEVLNSQGEIKNDQGKTLKPGDADYALHALTTARVKNFTVQAGGNDTPSTATQLGSGVSVFAGKSYAPFVIANGGTYFPGDQGIEDFVAAEQGKIDRFSSKDQYVRDLVATEGKDGDIFNNTPRFVQEPVAYFSFGAANPDGAPHFRSYGNGVYGFEDLPASFTQYSNNDFNDGVFALTLGI